MPWKARGLWTYEAKEEGELSFGVGDEITIIEERRNGWWKGELRGEVGEFPVNYCDVEGLHLTEDVVLKRKIDPPFFQMDQVWGTHSKQKRLRLIKRRYQVESLLFNGSAAFDMTV